MYYATANVYQDWDSSLLENKHQGQCRNVIQTGVFLALNSNLQQFYYTKENCVVKQLYWFYEEELQQAFTDTEPCIFKNTLLINVFKLKLKRPVYVPTHLQKAHY